jgi:uncharacterized membrane protein YtjA (UPF0391 family)
VLHYAAMFLVIALLAALLGSTGISVGSTEILFFAFPILLVTSYIVGLLRQK